MEKVAIFVDGSYLFHMFGRVAVKARIDYFKLARELAAGRELVKSFYYAAVTVPPKETQVRFHYALTSLGFKVVTIPLKTRGEFFLEKGVDVALTVDMLSMAFSNVYDVAVLVSGDGDFARAVLEVGKLEKKVEIAAFEESVASELRTAASKFVSLNSL